MRILTYKSLTVILLLAATVLAVISSSCVPSQQGNKSPIIASLESEYRAVYPNNTTEIKCDAIDPEGSKLDYKWSATDGKIEGDGPVVNWTSPNSYGDYHIMVIVSDIAGSSTQKTVTVSVVSKEQTKCCGRK